MAQSSGTELQATVPVAWGFVDDFPQVTAWRPAVSTRLAVRAAGFLASGGYALFASAPATPQTLIGVITQGDTHCHIHGNIQIGTGKRLYPCRATLITTRPWFPKPRADAGSAPKQKLKQQDGARSRAVNPSIRIEWRFVITRLALAIVITRSSQPCTGTG